MENAFYQAFCDLAVSPLQNPNRKLLVRPRKRPKKKGAAQTPRGLLFRELPLWCKQAFVPSGPFGRFWAEVLGGSARKSPFLSHQTGGVGKPGAPARLPVRRTQTGRRAGGGIPEARRVSGRVGNSPGILKRLLRTKVSGYQMRWLVVNG